MKIRDKLFLAFGFYILLAAAGGFFTFFELRTITTRLEMVKTADDINNAILEVRRHEKNFLLYKDDNSIMELKKHLTVLKSDIDNIRAEIISEIGADNYSMMRQTITEYEAAVDKLIANYGSQSKLETLLRQSGVEIERGLSGRELREFLSLRTQEKNLITFKSRAAHERFTKAAGSLSLGGRGDVSRYIILEDKLFKLSSSADDHMERLRAKARQVQTFTEGLSKSERMTIASILKMSMNLVIFALFAIVAIGVLINTKLAVSIVRPIKRLEKAIKKVAEGDFSEVVEVSGRDEIASLQTSFNQMEERLKDTLDSLDTIVEILKGKQAELVKNQARLVEAEKLASIGILTAGIAHEINNPLTSVLTFSNLMIEQMPEDDPRRERLKMMAKETMRARHIVRQLLSFAKESKMNPVRMNINQPLSELIDTLVAQNTFRDIGLKVNLADGLPEVNADPAQIRQVFLNIILNAVHSIEPPGRIEVSTRAEGGFVEITVSDTGIGIPEGHMGKIFDPFFTTKGATNGTGMGLAVSYGIIKKHGGGIRVKSAVGKGSTFTVRLPANA